MMELVFIGFLWGNQGGVKGIPLVYWDIFTLPKDQGVLSLLEIRVQRVAMSGKWVVEVVEGDVPW
jgi:hypothetical protein